MLLQISKLPKTPIDRIDMLPEASGIYLVSDEAKRVWYVGKSDNIKERHQQHEKRDLFLTNSCKTISSFCWGDANDIEDWEQENIEYYQPPLNWNGLKSHEFPLVNLGYDKSQYFSRYVEIKNIIRELETEMESLKPNLISILEENEGKIKTDAFSAFVTRRKTWSYSAEVLSLQEKLKVLKKQEEESGVASVAGYTVFPTVRTK